MLVVGLVMVLSSSTVTSLRGAGGSPYTLFLKQAQFAVIGIVVCIVAARMPVSFYRRAAIPLLGTAIMLQLLVFSPLGDSVNGNRNWLRAGPLSLQPSEIGKLAIVTFGAVILTAKRPLLRQWSHAVVPLLFPVGIGLVGLVLLGHDLGTALVFFAVIGAMLWAAGVNWRLFALAGTGMAMVAAFLVVGSGNRMGRINSWLSCTDIQQCWQARRGQFAIADGGLWGVGLGASREKWLWLPEASNDFIFAIIGEELGIAGTFLVLTLFAVLALACYRIVLQSHDMFVRIATVGVMAWIIGQAFVNIGAVIGLLPVIGIPLPLVSSGGSALVTTLAGLGMVISFARGEPGCRRALEGRPTLLSRSLSVFSGSTGAAAGASRSTGRRPAGRLPDAPTAPAMGAEGRRVRRSAPPARGATAAAGAGRGPTAGRGAATGRGSTAAVRRRESSVGGSAGGARTRRATGENGAAVRRPGSGATDRGRPTPSARGRDDRTARTRPGPPPTRGAGSPQKGRR